jgi:ABC-type uncharacterized transport system auxiliary subunit
MMRAAVVLLVLAAGCLARNAAEPRFFGPDSALLRESAESDPPAAAPRSLRAVRLRAVLGESYLRERVVWRVSALEYGFYEQRRWHELPAVYVEQALRTAFHKTGRVRVTDDLGVPSLHVALTAFDEVLAPDHVALVEATASLRDAHGQLLLERPFTAKMPIGGDDPTTMARAMGGALDCVATDIAAAVADAARPPVSARPRGRK